MTQDYINAHKEYYEYLDRFISSFENGVLVNQPDKIFDEEELSKIDLMWKNLQRLQKEWFDISHSKEKLED